MLPIVSLDIIEEKKNLGTFVLVLPSVLSMVQWYLVTVESGLMNTHTMDYVHTFLLVLREDCTLK